VTITSDLDLTAIFPGLHPFDGAQAPHFRGRERQVEDLLSVMQASRFIGVVGPEGSGKTSLVRAGLVPALQRGFRGVGGTAWQVCQFRPGITPIENLAFALANIDPEANDPRLSLERQLDFTAMFRADHSGLIRAAGALGLREGENLLVCIDGLEQLFELSGKYLPDMNSGQDAELFMSNIARLLGAPGMPVYVLVTLRSEHIPSLYNFRSLHPYLGTGLYTVPMFRNDDFAEVVRHGLQTCRIDPDAGTVEALRESFGQDLRQLPSLQSWLRKAAERYRPAAGTEDRVVLGANPLSALGPLDAAVPAMLEAFHEGLSERERHVMCQLFSHIAIPGEGQLGSKPQTVREVCERRDIPKAELDALLRRMARELPGILSVTEPYDKQVDHFREQPIPERSVLTLSNPWLLRGWKRLSEWLVAEREAASLYLRLSEAARMYALGQTALLRPPDLDLFHKWWETFRPQPAWTAQFNNQYRQADQYLKDSLSNHRSETERMEKERKEELRKARKRVMIGLTVGAVSLMIAIYAFFARKEAVLMGEEAKRSFIVASDKAVQAKKARDSAARSAVIAKELANRADKAMKEAQKQERIADTARKAAKRDADEATKQADIAKRNKGIADRESKEALRLKGIADSEQRKATAARDIAKRQADYQSAAKRVLDLLLKVRTSNFENRDSSIRFVRDVAEVYTAYDTSSRNLNGLSLPDNNLYELLWNTDALIRDSLKGKSVSRRQLAQFPANGIRGMRDVALFGRERMAAVGNDPNPVVLEIPGGKRLPVRLQDSSYRFRAVEFIDRDRLLLVDVKGNPYLLDLKKPDRLQSLQPNPSRREAVVSGLAVAGDEALMVRDGKLLAFSPAKPSDPREIPVPGRAEGVFPVGAGQVLVASSNGLHRYDPARKALNPFQTDGPIQQVTTVAQAGGRLFTGNQKGEVMAYEINPGKPDELRRIWDKPIKAHKTQVTALRYDPGEEQLYTAGLDRNANIYNLGLPKDRDIRNYALHLIGFRKWIWDLELVTGPQGSRLYSADESGTLQEWVTKDSEMHRRLGEFLKSETPRRP